MTNTINNQINHEDNNLDTFKATIIGQLSLIDELQTQNLRLIESIKFLKNEINLLTYQAMRSPYAITKETVC